LGDLEPLIIAMGIGKIREGEIGHIIIKIIISNIAEIIIQMMEIGITQLQIKIMM
jgi:hypothetical protein